ncbi:MAG: hypothetical protein ACFFAS_14830 [Promethearchaeota archaeon]
MLTSIVITNIIFSLEIPSRLKNFLMAFLFFGVIIHELSHVLASLLVGLKVKEVNIKWKNERTSEASPHGSVRLDQRGSFLQELVVSFAPLFLSTWLFFTLLDIALNAILPDLPRMLAGFACFSLLLGAAPSWQDIMLVGKYFKNDVRYSIYQIVLLSLSIALVLIVCSYYSVNVLDFLYYVFVGLGYYMFKYSIEAILLIVRSKQTKWKKWYVIKNIDKTTHRPLKPRQLRVKEAHW